MESGTKSLVYLHNKKTNRTYRLRTFIKGPFNVLNEDGEYVLLGTDVCSPTSTKIKLKEVDDGEYSVTILNKWRKGWVEPEEGNIRLYIPKFEVLNGIVTSTLLRFH